MYLNLNYFDKMLDQLYLDQCYTSYLTEHKKKIMNIFQQSFWPQPDRDKLSYMLHTTLEEEAERQFIFYLMAKSNRNDIIQRVTQNNCICHNKMKLNMRHVQCDWFSHLNDVSLFPCTITNCHQWTTTHHIHYACQHVSLWIVLDTTAIKLVKFQVNWHCQLPYWVCFPFGEWHSITVFFHYWSAAENIQVRIP